MIEMDEQFQREFGAAMASLRAVHGSLTGTAQNARGEAVAIAAAENAEAAVVAYESSHAYWDAAERVRPVIAAFEDADRRAAQLMAAPAPEEPRELRALRERARYLEDQLARIDTALRGRPATLDEKIRETETTEDLVDAAIRLIEDRPNRERAEREFERAQTLAEVTTKAARLLGAVSLGEIVPKLREALGQSEVDLAETPKGTLLAGEWISAAGKNRKTYVGRLFRVDEDGPVIEYVCECGDGADGCHTVSTKLSLHTVRLPTADEILAFDALSEKSGLLKLDDE